jgi:PiT family inorganic phosphate transporter
MHLTLNAVTLPFIGEVNLTGGILAIFLLCYLFVVAFEFVNGFHDTANAVATVIYTKALKPLVAVPFSGICNFLGVFTGGVAVAMGILKLVPLNDLMTLPVQVGACLVMAVLLTSIIWNLGTWWLGIPCSSSHTLIGAMIGGGLAFTWYYHAGSVNWDKAKEIGLSLLMSPIFGFGAAWLLMYLLRKGKEAGIILLFALLFGYYGFLAKTLLEAYVIKGDMPMLWGLPILGILVPLIFLKYFTSHVTAEEMFHIPHGDEKPPFFVRLLLWTTCGLVSFYHGSNDGQKGVGLLMLILIAFVPAKFAIDQSVPYDKIQGFIDKTQPALQSAAQANPAKAAEIDSTSTLLSKIKTEANATNLADNKNTFTFRKDVQSAVKHLKAITADKELQLAAADKETITTVSKSMNNLTDYAPVWVIATISISLGIGTMIGWKRIVLTIGEKIGKEHLNYAQGATAEITAAATIGLSTGFGLPVSTTHVLSSGIAGGMVATKGGGNLNGGTLRNIAMAWILTLPVCIILAIALFAVFHLFV